MAIRNLTHDRLPNNRMRDILRWMNRHQVADDEIVLCLGSRGYTYSVVRRRDRRTYDCLCADWSAEAALRTAAIQGVR